MKLLKDGLFSGIGTCLCISTGLIVLWALILAKVWVQPYIYYLGLDLQEGLSCRISVAPFDGLWLFSARKV